MANPANAIIAKYTRAAWCVPARRFELALNDAILTGMVPAMEISYFSESFAVREILRGYTVLVHVTTLPYGLYDLSVLG